jgi:hypothetical protein
MNRFNVNKSDRIRENNTRKWETKKLFAFIINHVAYTKDNNNTTNNTNEQIILQIYNRYNYLKSFLLYVCVYVLAKRVRE